jgi:S-adenosylmethionine:tRNA ribosyltransferase-isomerase
VDANELDFDLPPELVAQTPPEARDGGRMLVLDQETGAIEHSKIERLPHALKPALFVVNDTRVLPARIYTTKPTGGRIELLLIERLSSKASDTKQLELWSALARGTKSLRLGMTLQVVTPDGDDAEMTATVRALREGGVVEIALESADVRASIHTAGSMPLPPYIKRDVSAADRERYQTVFAAEEGSVAAPTAGLHFTSELLAAMGAAGHQVAKITLHVGPGTFAPLRTEALADHVMHEEAFVLPEETAEAITRAKAERRPIVAVGSTVTRVLESQALDGGVRAGAGRTDIFLYPPYQFRVIDALFTNFHLPRSTLLALVMAFGGTESVRAAYAAAVRERYRFFSYGDAMLVRPARVAR